MAKAPSTTETKKAGLFGRAGKQAEAEPAGKSAKKAQAKPTKGKKSKPSKPSKPNVFVRFVRYLGDVRAEMRRVVWPNRQEVVNSSIVVVVTLVFFTAFTAVFDALSSYVFIDILSGIGG